MNETTVNGEVISVPTRLVDGDRIAFSNLEFKVEFLRTEGQP